jgi:hypothetical protein
MTLNKIIRSFTVVLLLGAAGAVHAQQPPPPPGQQAPANQPGQIEPGVGRVSFIHGDVSVQHSGSSEWNAATLNTPISAGDHISTGAQSRAEVQLDYANVLRMSDQSTANITNYSRTQIQLQVGQGLVSYDVMKGSEADVEIDTPNVAIHPQLGEGGYRVTVNSDGETLVDVRNGSAEVSTPDGSTRVDKNQRITVQGTDHPQYQVSEASRKDDWDKWNSDRDHIISDAEAWRHTNRYYTGGHDLDTYGTWSEIPDYGPVWIPAARPGWAPYREGRWVWEPYYGWTWVSYEPWGWAPYHYGRWMVYGGGWCWWPGPVYSAYRPIWAPAYVSFFGFGGHFGVSAGFGYGNVGWLPIGPADPFFPWYGRGVSRVNVVNVTNITNITNIHEGGFRPLMEGRRGASNLDRASTDEHVRAGISSMQSGEFGHGRVPTQQQRVDAASFRQAGVMTGASPFHPTNESFRSTDRSVNPASIPNHSAESQRFFSRAGSSNGSPMIRQQGNSGAQTVQPQRTEGGFNRGGNTGMNQPQQGVGRPAWRDFGSGNAEAHGSAPTQGRGMNSSNQQGQRPFTPPASQQAPSNQPSESTRPGWRTFNSPSQPSQPSAPASNGNRNFDRQGSAPQSRPSYSPPPEASNGSGRNFGRQGEVPQSRPNFSQPAESPRQLQSNTRGNSGNSRDYGNSRPPLEMRQPIVTPRGGGGNYEGRPSGGSYSAPRSMPSGEGRGGQSGGGGNYGAGSRGGNPGGGNSAGRSSGGSSASGGHESSAGNHR